MKVNRSQERYRVERRYESIGQHGADQAAPLAWLPEDQVDAWYPDFGQCEDRLGALVGAVVLENLLNHHIVEGVTDGKHVSKVGHREGRPTPAPRASSP